MTHVGDTFQKETKYLRDKMTVKQLDWASKPPLYKSYPGSQVVKLPDIQPLSQVPLHELLKRRRSVRSYENKPLKLETISYLLWASTGISKKEGGYEFRTAPSAGALYPIETYLVLKQSYPS